MEFAEQIGFIRPETMGVDQPMVVCQFPYRNFTQFDQGTFSRRVRVLNSPDLVFPLHTVLFAFSVTDPEGGGWGDKELLFFYKLGPVPRIVLYQIRSVFGINDPLSLAAYAELYPERSSVIQGNIPEFDDHSPDYDPDRHKFKLVNKFLSDSFDLG